jgi:hypothetical protein
MATYDFKTKDQLAAAETLNGLYITSLKLGNAEDVKATLDQLASFVLGQGAGNNKPEVMAATTTQLPSNAYSSGVITAIANGVLPPQDGVTLIAGNRLLVKNEGGTVPSKAPPGHLKNGIYTITQVGSGASPFVLTRAIDMDILLEVVSAVVLVLQGTAHANSSWYFSADSSGVLGTTAIAVQTFIGSNIYQSYNAKLAELVALNWAANTFPTFSSTSTMVSQPITPYGLSVLSQTRNPVWGQSLARSLAFF